MLDILYNEVTYWLFGTAIIFTFVGRYIADKENQTYLVEGVIDSLIKNGYIKTKGQGEKLEILKHWETQDD